MSHDGRSARAAHGARATAADRRTGLLVIAGLTITLAVAACGGSSSSGGVAGATGTPLASTDTAAAASASTEASASAAGSGLNQGFLTFQEQNASKIFGGGTITDLGDGSSAVTLGVVAVGFADALPARLVSGSCADAAAAPAPSYAPPPPEPSAGPSAEASAAASVAPSVEPSAPAESGSPAPATLPIELTPVALGGSNTVVQIPLSDILAAPSSVLVYKSAADPQLVACSDVTPTLVLPSTAPGTTGSAAPSTEPSAMASGSTAP